MRQLGSLMPLFINMRTIQHHMRSRLTPLMNARLDTQGDFARVCPKDPTSKEYMNVDNAKEREQYDNKILREVLQSQYLVTNFVCAKM